MKRKKIEKAVSCLLLAAAMTVSTFPQFGTPVFAKEKAVERADGQEMMDRIEWMTPEDIKSYKPENPNDESDYLPFRCGRAHSKSSQSWRILGSRGDNLILWAGGIMLSVEDDADMAYEQIFDEPSENETKPYDEEWGCTYQGETPTEVAVNHYGGSRIRKVLKKIEKTNFTEEERKHLRPTTIYTEDMKNHTVYSTTDILYLPYGMLGEKSITIGANSPEDLNSGINFFPDGYGMWLRAPHPRHNNWGFYWGVAEKVKESNVSSLNGGGRIRPACEYDISDLLFACNTPQPFKDDPYLGHDGCLIPRFRAKEDLGSAQVSYDKTEITVKNVPKNRSVYLMVGYDNGYLYTAAKRISEDTVVSVDDMIPNSCPLADGKVWLESLPEGGGMLSYAEMAEWEQGYDVNIAADEGKSLIIVDENGSQKVGLGKAIQDITVEVAEGFYLPEGYIDSIQGLEDSGLTVILNETKGGFTISGTPTSDVTITLPAATKKVCDMAVAGNGTFTTVCKDYQPITANEFTITNNGNVDLTNVNVSLTGTDADKFELSADNTTATIQPNGTIKVTVKPDNDLGVGTYQATLSVSADNVNTATTDLQFTVSEHDYNTVVTPPTCTEKGYTTYTCKNCNHSYVGDEVAAKGHTFGEWEIITSPTCDQDGSRKHTCKDCGYVEIENLNSTGHDWETEYTVDKEPTCTEDGSKSIHCKNCDAVKDSTTIPKLGHSFTNYISNNDATCTKDGTKTAKCDRCAETDTVVDTGTMLEHEYEWVYNNDAACEKNGTETGTCKHCKTTITREKADTALGHEFKNYVSDDNATCTENGTETAKCERCDKTDTRVQENSALGHDLGEWRVIKDATTTETGIKERHCARCDYKETETIPVISKPAQPNDNSSDKDNSNADTNKESPKTGDQTNAGFFTALLSMSALGIAVLTVLKKKKALEHK